MCDYSLMGVPTRLAKDGEELVVYRFRTGSLGLASEGDLGGTAREGLWGYIKTLFRSLGSSEATAVCIAPGAQLLMRDIPHELQSSIKVGPVEEVVFTQLSAEPHAYRDAVRFSNGSEVLLQRLKEGQRVRILRLSLVDELSDPVVGDAAYLKSPLAG
jgi:hypothetical protein